MQTINFSNGHHFRAPWVIWASLALTWIGAYSQAAKRCDLIVNTTPGAPATAACLDLVALAAGGNPIPAASNTTRISTTGMTLCKNAFEVTTGVGADIVFIFDNSGSMWSHRATIDTVNQDTTFWDAATNCLNTTSANTMSYVVQDTAFNRPPQSLTKTVPVLANNQTNCSEYAGDPYNARGVVIRNAINYLATKASNSTAGVIGFADVSQNPQPPLQLNNPTNVAQVLSMVRLDSVPDTRYAPPLQLAKTWLNDTTIIKTQKQAIVFISDGKPNDGNQGLNLVDANMPPIYSIFLGRTSTPDTANLKTLSDRSGGLFFHVDASKPAAIQVVMDSIIKSIVSSALPQSIAITNTTLAPPQVSKSTNLSFDAASGDLKVTLDSIIALHKGANAFQVAVTAANGTVKTYTFSVNADGAELTQTTQNQVCYDPPSLVMLDNGKIDSVYPFGNTTYTVRLTRPASGVGTVTVQAISKDSTKATTWGDAESLNLPVTSNTGGTTVNQGTIVVNGSNDNPTANNNTLESDANGLLVLTWVHPRDPREFASYTLPGSKVPVITDTLNVTRLLPYPTGPVITTKISNPVVITGGDVCISNCGSEAEHLADTNKVPTFTFKAFSTFSYSYVIYDHLGQFVQKTGGAVDPAQFVKGRLPNQDSVRVKLKILPVTKDGRVWGSGVYILRLTINTEGGTVRDARGNPVQVFASTQKIVNRFGYVHP